MGLEPTGILASALAYKILGPTADYLGGEMKNATEKRLENFRRIMKKARNKLGDRINSEGAVSPRVLKAVINEGSFCNDELTAEYFGGVLASSKTGVSRDDRGVVLMALLSKLSTYQIRTHYIFYSLLKKHFDGAELNMGNADDRRKMRIFLPVECYIAAMDIGKTEDPNLILEHSLYGLMKESLIYTFAIGSEITFPDVFKNIKDFGIMFQPAGLGVELYLWAHGRGDLAMKNFINPQYQFHNEIEINIPAGAKPFK